MYYENISNKTTIKNHYSYNNDNNNNNDNYDKYSNQMAYYIFFFFDYGPFKNISLIWNRSFIKGGRKPENPEKNRLTIRKQKLAFPHVTRARLEPQQ